MRKRHDKIRGPPIEDVSYGNTRERVTEEESKQGTFRTCFLSAHPLPFSPIKEGLKKGQTLSVETVVKTG